MSTTESSVGVHETRQPDATQKKIIDDVLCLYQLKPSEQAYSHYDSTAVFHDPVSIAKGLDSIKSQFNGMPKLFAESTTQKCDMLATSTAEKIELNLTQHYIFKSPIPFKSKGTEKTVNSKITFHMNSQGLIQNHDEEWDHQENKDDSDGFFGKIQAYRKKADAKLVESTVSSDPSKV